MVRLLFIIFKFIKTATDRGHSKAKLKWYFGPAAANYLQIHKNSDRPWSQ